MTSSVLDRRRFLLAPLVGAVLAPRFARGAALLGLEEDPDDEALRRAWKKLAAEDRGEIVAWFEAECGRLTTFQATLANHVFLGLDVDRYGWPEAPSRAPLYDARVHCPADPIVRRYVGSSTTAAKRWRSRLPTRRLRPAWRYDYGSRTVQRVARRNDPDRIFENALAGFLPEHDLVEALVERALDDGAQQAVLAAFGHGYSDRAGRAIPGVTLYDAWSSGHEIEMPDVECLGIVHDVLDDWRTWTAPVPDRQHDALYERIGALFTAARRHRGLRHALARTYLAGEPELADGYDASPGTLHAIWESVSSDPAALASELPASRDWEAWLEARAEAPAKDAELAARAAARRATLVADAARVRGVLVWVMREYGAIGR